ncbi:hypothetical protein [Botryobacter ruber]|uniref:hypothetical protein n=1 Tax=Botryobacter ruber TaxID=2171629 RepID=UPI000F6548B5|nr:hypothetical protein [Botryobacter ruber]
MKKLYFLLLCLLASSAYSQKATFRAYVSGNFPVIADVEKQVTYDSSLPYMGYYQIPQQEKATIKTSFKEKPGGRFGGTVAVGISPKFALETGLLATLVRFQKSNSIAVEGNQSSQATDGSPFGSSYGFRFKDVYGSEDSMARDKDGNLIYDANGNPIRMRFSQSSPDGSVIRRWQDGSDATATQHAPEPYRKAGNTTILYLDLPVIVRYNLHRFFDVKAGFTTSLVAYSERILYFSNYDIPYMPAASTPTWTHSDSYGSYGKVKNGGGISKTLFALNAGVTLKATRHIGFDLDYARYLTPIYTSRAETHKYNLFSSGMSYAF